MTQHFLLFQIQYIFSEIGPCALTWKYSNDIQILLHVAPGLTGFLCRSTHRRVDIYFAGYANSIMNINTRQESLSNWVWPGKQKDITKENSVQSRSVLSHNIGK